MRLLGIALFALVSVGVTADHVCPTPSIECICQHRGDMRQADYEPRTADDDEFCTIARWNPNAAANQLSKMIVRGRAAGNPNRFYFPPWADGGRGTYMQLRHSWNSNWAITHQQGYAEYWSIVMTNDDYWVRLNLSTSDKSSEPAMLRGSLDFTPLDEEVIEYKPFEFVVSKVRGQIGWGVYRSDDNDPGTAAEQRALVPYQNATKLFQCALRVYGERHEQNATYQTWIDWLNANCNPLDYEVEAVPFPWE